MSVMVRGNQNKNPISGSSFVAAPIIVKAGLIANLGILTYGAVCFMVEVSFLLFHFQPQNIMGGFASDISPNEGTGFYDSAMASFLGSLRRRPDLTLEEKSIMLMTLADLIENGKPIVLPVQQGKKGVLKTVLKTVLPAKKK